MFLYLEVVGSTITIHHYPALIKHLSGIGAGLIHQWYWMDPALVLDQNLFDVLYLEVVGSTSTIHHYPKLIKHLSGIGAGLIQHWCRMDPAPVMDPKLFDVIIVLRGGWEHQHHYISIQHSSSIYLALVLDGSAPSDTQACTHV